MSEPSPDKLLSIYLNDHLAGSTLGVDLVKRSARSNRGTPLGDLLKRLTAEIVEDRATLERLMDRFEARPDRIKVAGAWAAEKAGRLKLNGRLMGYSPLSRVVELENLHLGITGKRDMWKALSRALGIVPGFDFEELAGRAERQLRDLEPHHREAAAQAFSGAATPTLR
jgi:hypothetical protein